MRWSHALPTLAASCVRAGIAAACLGCLASPAAATTRNEALSELRQLDQPWNEAVEAIAEQCKQLQRPALETQTRAMIVNRDRRSTGLFLSPRETGAEDLDDIQRSWRRRLTTLQKARAAKLFEKAKALAVEHPSIAYQLCFEALHLDPDSLPVRNALGYTRAANGASWKRAGFYGTPPTLSADGIRISVSKQRPNPNLGIAAHWRIRTAHFEILSEPGQREGEQLALEIEAVFDAWSQLFTKLWIDGATLHRRLQSGAAVVPPARRFRVVLYSNRTRYLAMLRKKEPRIDMSVGYYRPDDKTSYFYWDEDSPPRQTWRHEVTHQLFAEVRRAAPNAGLRQNYWLLEGIAMYVESLRIRGSHCLVGGPGVDRLQFARLRMAPDDRELNRLLSMGRVAMQDDPSVSTLYSSAAGLCCFLMDAEQGQHRDACVQLLMLVYQGRDNKNSLLERTGIKNAEELLARYHKFLKEFEDEDIADLGFIENLCLRHSKVSPHGLAQIQARELRWLDIAGQPYDDAALAPLLSTARKLEKLNLEATPITDATLTPGQWPNLIELDLSQTSVTASGVSRFGILKLQVLWLTGTMLDPSILNSLEHFQHLRFLNLGGIEGISRQSVTQLEKKLPQLKSVDFAQ